MKNIAVFCSSSNALDERFYELAQEFGQQLAKNGYNLVYGGANVGMMKVIADSAKANGAKVIGVIPKFFAAKGLTEEGIDEVIFVRTMAERKDKIIKRADAFVILPGGFGTMDEFFEVLVLKQIAVLKAPIVVLNFEGFYDKLLEQIELFFQLNFAKPKHRHIYYVSTTVAEVFDYLNRYKPIVIDNQWFKVDKKDFER